MCVSGTGSHMVNHHNRETIMTINLSVPQTMQELCPRITVVGVGGAGGNAVNNMISADLDGVDFLVANTDGPVSYTHLTLPTSFLV